MRGGLLLRTAVASGMLAIVVGGAFAVLLVAVEDLRASARMEALSETELDAADRLERLVIDMETGLRGFVITRQEEFLQPFNAARAMFLGQIAALESHEVNRTQASRLRKIGRDVEAYVNAYALVLIGEARRGQASARSIAATGTGKRRVDAIRAQFAAYQALQLKLRSMRQGRDDALTRRAVIASTVGLGGSLALVVLFGGYLARALVLPVRRVAGMATRLARGNLAVRVPERGIGETRELERAFNSMAVAAPVMDALGRVLAEPVWALRSSPAFPAAAMDGIAVRALDTRGAAPGRPVRLAMGSFDLVDTGNPLPPGRDAVVMRERVRFDRSFAEVEAEAAPWHHVRPIGEDVALGELLFVAGHRLRPVDLAAAAAAGVTRLTVRRPARVAIPPTGDELRPADAILAPGELADTNSLMLDGLAREAGCETRVWPILPDDPEQLSAALVAAAAHADVVLLVAGTSAGRHDYAPDVLRDCGRIVVQGVAIRPGHPAVLGVVDRTPVMACPGYPVSAALAFEELARPLIASLEGASASRRCTMHVHLASDVRSKPGARHLLRVRVGTVDGGRVAMPLRGGASVLSSLVHADALLAIPADRVELRAAAPVDAELWRSGSPPDDALLLAGARDWALELLAIAFAGAPDRHARIAFCETASEDAVGLVRDGMCHAAAVAGSAASRPTSDRALLAVRLATCNVGVTVAAKRSAPTVPAELLRSGLRVAVAPHGTPARRVLDDAARATGATGFEIVEARSDAAALATLAGGCADCAVSTVPAARHAGLTATPLGRVALDLLIHRRVARRDPLARGLLETLRSRSLAIALEGAGYEPGAGARHNTKRDRALKSRVIGELRRMSVNAGSGATT